MPAWPLDLPALPFAGVTARDDDAVLRTSMDTGPVTRRNRYTAISQTLALPMVLDGAEKATFDFFYRSTLKNGSLAFDWTDPVDDAVVSMAFKSPPQWAAFAGDADPAKRGWQATLELEIQP